MWFPHWNHSPLFHPILFYFLNPPIWQKYPPPCPHPSLYVLIPPMLTPIIYGEKPSKSGIVWLTCYLLWRSLEKVYNSFIVFSYQQEKKELSNQVLKFRHFSVLKQKVHRLWNKMYLDSNPSSFTSWFLTMVRFPPFGNLVLTYNIDSIVPML